MTKIGILGLSARKEARETLDGMAKSAGVRRDRMRNYFYENDSGFRFVFMPNLEIRPYEALFQPGVAICHEPMAAQLQRLREEAGSLNRRPKKDLTPNGFLHLFGLRLRKNTSFDEVSPLLEALREEFGFFLDQRETYSAIDGPAPLLAYLKKTTALYGPSGLLIEMFLDRFLLNKTDFIQKYESRELAPMHRQYFEAFVRKYEQDA